MRSISRHLTFAGVVAVIAVFAALGASASANTIKYPTTIEQGTSWVPTSDFQVIFFAGNVRSPKRACVANRTVKEIAVTGDQRVLIDTDRTSDKGAWATGGRIEGNPDQLIAQVTRKRIGRHHQNVCKAASVVLGVT